MKQAIAGVAPPQLGEVSVTTVWPSIAATGMGQFLGRLYSIETGVWIVTVGRVMALVTIPIALGLFVWMLLPGVMRRYRLTNRRVISERGLSARAESYVDLDRFDSIELLVLPGQAWYPAGELIFRKGQVETFRLSGVPHPESFRQTCLKAQLSYAGVHKATAGA